MSSDANPPKQNFDEIVRECEENESVCFRGHNTYDAKTKNVHIRISTFLIFILKIYVGTVRINSKTRKMFLLSGFTCIIGRY